MTELLEAELIDVRAAVGTLRRLLNANQLHVIHEEGGHELPLKIEIQPNGEVTIWVE